MKRYQRAMRASCVYFLAMFGAGWAFGVVYETLIFMGVESLTAVLFEAPALLLIMYLSSAWIGRSFRIPPRLRDRLAMGVPAVALLLGADLFGSVALRGWTLQAILAEFATAPGVALAVLLLLGLLMPVLQMQDQLAR